MVHGTRFALHRRFAPLWALTTAAVLRGPIHEARAQTAPPDTAPDTVAPTPADTPPTEATPPTPAPPDPRPPIPPARGVPGAPISPPPPATGDQATSASAGRRLSIRDAVRLAQTTSDALRRARAVASARRGAVRAARSGYFPQIALSASYQRTLKSEYEGIFDAPEMPGAPFAFEELPFGQANTYRFGASITQNLYAGGTTRAETTRASAVARSAQLDVVSARAQAVLDVAQAYYDAVLSDRFVAIAAAALDQATQTLEEVRASYEAGTRPEFELVRARVAVDLQRPVLIRQQTARSLAYLRLRQLLDLPESTRLVLTSTLDDDELAPLTAEARKTLAGLDVSLTQRTAVRQAALALEASEAGMSAARAGLLPSVDLFMTYGRVAYPEDLFPSWDEFRTNWVAGVSLSWTIFDGLRTYGNLQAARGAREDARVALKQARELAEYEHAQVQQELVAARAVWESTASATQEATRAYEIARVRYDEGVSTQLELTDARLRLQQAQADRARAARDLQVARVRLTLLPALPFSAPLTPAAEVAPAAVPGSAARGAATSVPEASGPTPTGTGQP